MTPTNPIAKVGETYKGFTIIEIKSYRKGWFGYLLECNKCKGRQRKGHSVLLEKGSYEGCRKCYETAEFQKGTLVGSFEIIGVVSDPLNRRRYYIFKCITCGYQSKATHERRVKHSGCKACKKANPLQDSIKVGSKYGRLTVLQNDIIIKGSVYDKYSQVECECGKRGVFKNIRLANGKTTECTGCRVKRSWATRKNVLMGILDNTPKIPNLKEYNNIYLNLCRQPRSLEEILAITKLDLAQVQSDLLDVQLEDKIKVNAEGLWETL